jgi:predicted metal-dependent peptidase
MAIPKSLQTARMFLASEYDYVGALLWALRPQEIPGLGTMGVDRHWHLAYDPNIDAKWSEPEVLGVLFHEINHILRNHLDNGRAEPFIHCHPFNSMCKECRETAARFNICGDLEINPGILKLGFKLPSEGQFPKTYGLPDGLLAEEYWHKLPKDVGKEGKSYTIGAGKCGSCAGNPGDHEKGDAPGQSDGDEEGQGLEGISAAERELIIRDVAKKIEEAAKTRGNVPAGLDRWANDYLHPKVPWRRELRNTTHRNINECAGKREYSFKRPHRRQGLAETIMPTMKDFFPRIGIIRDTSGSMSETDLARSIAETRGVLKEMGGEIVDIEVDCAVHGVKTVKNVREIKLQGGGGTDMGVGIRHADGLRPKLDVCIVITDGETPWPATPPHFKTIVVLTRSGSEAKVPSWCKTILIND